MKRVETHHFSLQKSKHFYSTVYGNKGMTFESMLGFNVIKRLIQNSVLTKVHAFLQNISQNLNNLIESVFKRGVLWLMVKLHRSNIPTS